MKLEGKTIYLRPIKIEDANSTYVNWLNDKEINQYLESRFVLATTENVKKFIENIIQTTDTFFFQLLIKSQMNILVTLN